MAASFEDYRLQETFAFSSQVCVEAQNRELQSQKQINLTPECDRALNQALEEIYHDLQPSPVDVNNRRDLINRINHVLSNHMRGSYVDSFGSYEMDMTSAGGDLDLSLEIAGFERNRKLCTISREYKVPFVRQLKQVMLRKQRDGMVRNVEGVFGAIVPLVKFVDVSTNIQCDISLFNRDGVFKSRLFKMISKLDPRFRPLCYLVKAWARYARINDPRNGTLNSMSLILLVAFHLQTRSPPILPPFHIILNENPREMKDLLQMNSHEIDQLFTSCNYRIERMASMGAGRRNTSTLSQLFISFFLQLSELKDLWGRGLCASTYFGKWIKKTDFEDEKHLGSMAVEDFVIRGQNCARTIRPPELNKVYHQILLATDVFHRSMDGIHFDPRVTCVRLFGSHATRNVKPHTIVTQHKVIPRPIFPKRNHSLLPNSGTLEEYIHSNGMHEPSQYERVGYAVHEGLENRRTNDRVIENHAVGNRVMHNLTENYPYSDRRTEYMVSAFINAEDLSRLEETEARRRLYTPYSRESMIGGNVNNRGEMSHGNGVFLPTYPGY